MLIISFIIGETLLNVSIFPILPYAFAFAGMHALRNLKAIKRRPIEQDVKKNS